MKSQQAVNILASEYQRRESQAQPPLVLESHSGCQRKAETRALLGISNSAAPPLENRRTGGLLFGEVKYIGDIPVELQNIMDEVECRPPWQGRGIFQLNRGYARRR
jgi:hypothetical protein